MLGGYISDLEAGDVFELVEYVLTAFMTGEYAHGVEENCEWFHSSRAPGGRQVRPPPMIHVDKMRILARALRVPPPSSSLPALRALSF